MIASNRLPVRVSLDDERGSSSQPARAVSPRRSGQSRATRSGSAGRERSSRAEPRAEVAKRLGPTGCVPVFLTADERGGFYGRICNDTLWPLFHYFRDRLQLHAEAWERYVEVNERFADAIAEQSARPAPGSGFTTSI